MSSETFADLTWPQRRRKVLDALKAQTAETLRAAFAEGKSLLPPESACTEAEFWETVAGLTAAESAPYRPALEAALRTDSGDIAKVTGLLTQGLTDARIAGVVGVPPEKATAVRWQVVFLGDFVPPDPTLSFAKLSESDRMVLVLNAFRLRASRGGLLLPHGDAKDPELHRATARQLWQTVLNLARHPRHKAELRDYEGRLRDLPPDELDEIRCVAKLASDRLTDAEIEAWLGLTSDKVSMRRCQARYLRVLQSRRVYTGGGRRQLSRRLFTDPLETRLGDLRAAEGTATWHVPKILVPVDTRGGRDDPNLDWDLGVVNFGELAAEWLFKTLKKHTRIGVTGGRTVRACVDGFRKRAAARTQAQYFDNPVTCIPLVAKRHVIARADDADEAGAAARPDARGAELSLTADSLAIDLGRALNRPEHVAAAAKAAHAAQIPFPDLTPFVPPESFAGGGGNDDAAEAYHQSMAAFAGYGWAFDRAGGVAPPLDLILTSVETPFAFAPVGPRQTYAGVPAAWVRKNLAGCVGNWPILRPAADADRERYRRIGARFIGAKDHHFRGWVRAAGDDAPGVIAVAFRNSQHGATGSNRAAACLAAMRAGLISTLVLDAGLARDLYALVVSELEDAKRKHQ